MSIFSRTTEIVKANLNDMLDKAEDPEKMIKQMVSEMEEAVNNATLALGTALGNQKSLERTLENKVADLASWQKKAEEAVDAGRDDLAKSALERKNVVQKNVTELQALVADSKKVTENIRTQTSQLRTKLEEAHMRESTLIARSRSAKAKQQISKSLGGIGNDSFAGFDRMEEKVERQEATADAFSEIAGDKTSLDDEFKKLETTSDVDSDLAALKAARGGKS